MLSKNLPPAERGSGDQTRGSRLDRLLVSCHCSSSGLSWQLTLGKAFVGHSCSSKWEDRGDRKGERCAHWVTVHKPKERRSFGYEG
jgi:hypothetical protein